MDFRDWDRQQGREKLLRASAGFGGFQGFEKVFVLVFYRSS